MEEITKLLTIREIAQYLRCSKTHVGNLMLGRVPGAPPLVHLTIGRRKVVRRESLNAWLAASEVTSGSRGGATIQNHV